jgi:quercetin dioxygenase-like cupin family protein
MRSAPLSEHVGRHTDRRVSLGGRMEIDMTATPAQSQPPGITRTGLQRHELGVPGREAVQDRVEIAPGVASPRHSHPAGDEIVDVIDGVMEYQVEGQPPATLEAGEILFAPAGTIHAVRNVGRSDAAERATHVVETGSRSSCWPSERPVRDAAATARRQTGRASSPRCGPRSDRCVQSAPWHQPNRSALDPTAGCGPWPASRSRPRPTTIHRGGSPHV